MNPSWYHNTSWKSIVFTFKQHLWNSLTYLGGASVKREINIAYCIFRYIYFTANRFDEFWTFHQKVSHQDTRNGHLQFQTETGVLCQLIRSNYMSKAWYILFVYLLNPNTWNSWPELLSHSIWMAILPFESESFHSLHQPFLNICAK